MQVVIDRFEGEFAVVELSGGAFVNLPRVLVPEAKEGDVIHISIDAAERSRREQAVEELMNDLFSD